MHDPHDHECMQFTSAYLTETSNLQNSLLIRLENVEDVAVGDPNQ